MNLEDLINKVKDFPTLPTVYNSIMDVMANPRSTINDVANVISQDQASASKLLRAANSSIYGFRGRINNVSQAIFYLGFDEVKNLVAALSIIDLFKNSPANDSFNPVNFWKHSIGVGLITRIIGSSLGVKDIENYFISGILHDIGKLLFYRVIPEDYAKAINYANEKNISLRDAEVAIIGISHLSAGEMLAEKWKMPQTIRDCIRYHYVGTINSEFDDNVAVVHIANILAGLIGIPSLDEFVQEPNQAIWSKLKIGEGMFVSIVDRININYTESIELLLSSKS
jgi:HD-like signal output (HDOD) protein